MFRRASLATGATACLVAVLISGCGGGTSGATPTAGQPGSPTAHSSTTSQGSSGSSVSKAVLDAYVANAEKGMTSALGSSVRKIYASIHIEAVYPDGIRYVYVFKNAVDPAVGAKVIGKSAPVLRATFRTEVAPEMRKLGIAHPTVTWRYVNPDGSLVWTRTYS